MGAPRSSLVHMSQSDGRPSSRYSTQPKDGYDVVIIGGGAAGLSAGLVLARARRRVLVVDEGPPRNAPATHMHGFLSRDGMPPADLLTVGREEVARYGAAVVTDSVRDVVQLRSARGSSNVGFAVFLGGGQRVQARRVLVTTGLTDQLPEVEATSVPGVWVAGNVVNPRAQVITAAG